MTDARQPSRARGRARPHPVLRMVAAVICLAVAGAGAFAGYKYYTLRPVYHFQTVPVVNGPPEVPAQASFNVLLIGSDQRPGDVAGHSDSLLLVHADLRDRRFNVLSIPRDTRVYMPGHGYTKLTSVQYVAQAELGKIPGIERAVAAVQRLTGVDVNYYAVTNYWGLQGLVDAVGGIDMDIPFDVRLTHPWYPEDRGRVIRKGVHHLDGKMVTEVVHERDSLPEGDFSRQQLQEEALKGIARALLRPAGLVHLPEFVQQLPNFLIATNMSTDDILSLALAARGVDLDTQVHYYQVEGASQTLYDNILEQRNDQFVPNLERLRQVAQTYFTDATEPGAETSTPTRPQQP
ncbi:LCP family protein [Alicyclobacillus sp.]|uniref:LCP family protein n=1 Tax=Alicyclobacillus sp. TaxID=61169 RepID=UPI0025BE1FB4|nr:LCP family protein [Alicyclobacillus sp.]MCL6517556.1 LCP family protein [Alicyclobacillus sp.]